MTYLDTGYDLINLINDKYKYKAYIVGGAVRDHLLGYDISDIDIATNMPLDEINKYFDVVDNGSKYLSITINYKNYSFEVTNFRTDLKYYNHRHPLVKLVDDYKEDSKRRDFTINALALDKDKTIVDYYNGINDLENKIIRTIGNPDVRFEEDSLRILRGLYLKAKLDFDFDLKTLYAVKAKKNLLSELSLERLSEYYYKLLKIKNDKFINFVKKNNIFDNIDYFLKYLEISEKNLKNYENAIIYYHKYNSYPFIINKNEKKLVDIYFDIVDSNFSKLSYYNNKKDIDKLYNIFRYFKFDVDKIKDDIDNLIIKDDKELALSKKDIADYFDHENKKIAINKIIEEILLGKLLNDKDEIKRYILEKLV